MPYQSAGVSCMESSSKSTAKRLRRTRQRLGSYRHDLLVAMRVVNNVEQEMIRAEWENFLLDENTRCKQVGRMLAEGRSTSDTSKKSNRPGLQKETEDDAENARERTAAVKSWQDEYCGSCKLEQDMLQRGGKHLSFE